jgi:ATP synthase F1 gamma subunit
MRPVSELKQDFDVVRSLADIIDVLKTTAMIQFRTFQLKERPNEDFSRVTEDSLGTIMKKVPGHPYLVDRKGMISAVVVVTSDEGFLGELNTLLVNNALDHARSKTDEIIVMGERGARYLEDIERPFVLFQGITDDLNYREIERIRDYLLKGYHKRFGRIMILYPKFISMTSQRVTAFQFLPYQPNEESQGPVLSPVMAFEDNMLLVEPSVTRVLNSLIELWAGFKLLEIFWLSKQSEFAARIMHLEGSTQEISHLRQRLSFEYFKQVHALKDKVIREISESKIMLGKK